LSEDIKRHEKDDMRFAASLFFLLVISIITVISETGRDAGAFSSCAAATRGEDKSFELEKKLYVTKRSSSE